MASPQRLLPTGKGCGAELRANVRNSVELDGAVAVACVLDRAYACCPSSTIGIDPERWPGQWLNAAAFSIAAAMTVEKLPLGSWSAFLQPVWRLGRSPKLFAADAHVVWLLLPSRAAGLAEAFCRGLHEQKSNRQAQPPERAKQLRPSNVTPKNWAGAVTVAGVSNSIPLHGGEPARGGGDYAETRDRNGEDADEGSGDGGGSFYELIRRPLDAFVEKYAWKAVARAWKAFDAETGRFANLSHVRALGVADLAPNALFRIVRLDLQARFVIGATLFGPRRTTECDPTANPEDVAPRVGAVSWQRGGAEYQLVQPTTVPLAEYSTNVWSDLKARWGDEYPLVVDTFLRHHTTVYEIYVEDAGFAEMSEADRRNFATRTQQNFADLSDRTMFCSNLTASGEFLVTLGGKISEARCHGNDDVVAVLHIVTAACDAYRRLRDDDPRSEGRRVGKGWRSRWSPDQ